MQFKFRGVTISVSYVFIAVVGLFIITDKTGFAEAAVLAAAVHELGHIAAMILVKSVPKSISLCSFGIRIVKNSSISLSLREERFIYLAGPLVNLFCAGIFMFAAKAFKKSFFLRISLLHIVTALFNLLPIGVLDGGNIVKTLLAELLPIDCALKTQRLISLIFLIPIFIAALLLLASDYRNYTLIITCIYLSAMLLSGR